MSFKQTYSDFYSIMNKSQNKSKSEELDLLFIELNKTNYENIKATYKKLFNITNFCSKNMWGSYYCTLCRMTFLQESQYNEHEQNEIHNLNLKKCADIRDKIFNSYINPNDFHEFINNAEIFEPIVFLSIAEHNSNALPWRETASRIIYIETNNEELINYQSLEEQLEKYKKNIIKIGSFTAASNISGIYTDTDYLSYLMHKSNGLAFFDYATAAPYVKIDICQPLTKEYKLQLGII